MISEKDLTFLLVHPSQAKIHDIAELRGDLLLMQSGARADIITLYESGITPLSRDRIREKINLLIAPPVPEKSLAVPTKTGATISST